MNTKVVIFKNTAEYLLALAQRKKLMALGKDISEEQQHEFEDLNSSIKLHESAVTLITAGVIRR